MTAPGLDAILAAIPGATLVCDDAGRVAFTSAEAEMLLNTASSQMIGRRMVDVLALPPAIAALLTGDGPAVAHDVRVFNGLRLDLRVAPIGGHRGWRVVIGTPAARPSDHHGARAAGVAAMLAHELRNPLSGIRGAAQLLGRDTPDRQALSQLIMAEVDRIAALIATMETFGDDRPQVRTAHNVHSLIDHAVASAKAGISPNATFVAAYDPSLPPVLVHGDSIIQALINLIKNASEAADRPTITITTRYHGGVARTTVNGGRIPLPVELTVADDGPGPDAALTPHLFEPFVTSKPNGRGLGLAIVAKLMRDTGGLVEHGGGSTFRLRLERAA